MKNYKVKLTILNEHDETLISSVTTSEIIEVMKNFLSKKIMLSFSDFLGAIQCSWTDFICIV